MTAIKTEYLTKRFNDITALDNLTLDIPENVVFGFLGPNGAGKTTTVKLLTGFTRPTSGTVTVAGEPVTSENTKLRSQIGLLPDVPAFYDWMTGREYLRFVGEIHQLSDKDIRERSGELLEMTELKRAGKRRIGGYSRGMKQRLGIAQALINRPKVLFLDEPTSALDPLGRREILTLIKQLRQSMTIFLSTHILSDVERVCDMVGIVDNGKLITTSTVHALKAKYTKSAFEIEVLEDPERVIDLLLPVEWLSDPEIVDGQENHVVRVTALDAERAQQELPKLITDGGISFVRYEMSSPSLEDIFVEIVNEEKVK